MSNNNNNINIKCSDFSLLCKCSLRYTLENNLDIEPIEKIIKSNISKIGKSYLKLFISIIAEHINKNNISIEDNKALYNFIDYLSFCEAKL